jgi:hypothetical protein
MTLTAGIAVFDREAAQFVHQQDADRQFRSASVVKLLIALDYFWDRGPAYDVPPADQERLDVMLRSSDDDAASYYWEQLGGAAIVDRMVQRLGLTHTAGPPASHPGFWGYVAITAADTVRVYRYLLEDAPAPVRKYVMGQLHQATRHGTDGFDQYFGIASVFETGYSIKQGWSGFQGSSGYRSDKARPQSVVDLVNAALHTTGTVGPDDRSIVAVFTLHPSGTPYEQAYAAVTQLTAALTVPGGVHVQTAGK